MGFLVIFKSATCRLMVGFAARYFLAQV